LTCEQQLFPIDSSPVTVPLPPLAVRPRADCAWPHRRATLPCSRSSADCRPFPSLAFFSLPQGRKPDRWRREGWAWMDECPSTDGVETVAQGCAGPEKRALKSNQGWYHLKRVADSCRLQRSCPAWRQPCRCPDARFFRQTPTDKSYGSPWSSLDITIARPRHQFRPTSVLVYPMLPSWGGGA
jgi:hypothetical protein